MMTIGNKKGEKAMNYIYDEKVLKKYKEIISDPKFVNMETIFEYIENERATEIKKLNKNSSHVLYPSDHVFDENKSVKWNREEVIRKNQEIKKLRTKISEVEYFYNQLARCIITHDIISSDINEAQVEEIYLKAVERADYWLEIWYEADELADFYRDLKNLEK